VSILKENEMSKRPISDVGTGQDDDEKKSKVPRLVIDLTGLSSDEENAPKKKPTNEFQLELSSQEIRRRNLEAITVLTATNRAESASQSLSQDITDPGGPIAVEKVTNFVKKNPHMTAAVADLVVEHNPDALPRGAAAVLHVPTPKTMVPIEIAENIFRLCLQQARSQTEIAAQWDTIRGNNNGVAQWPDGPKILMQSSTRKEESTLQIGRYAYNGAMVFAWCKELEEKSILANISLKAVISGIFERTENSPDDSIENVVKTFAAQFLSKTRGKWSQSTFWDAFGNALATAKSTVLDRPAPLVKNLFDLLLSWQPTKAVAVTGTVCKKMIQQGLVVRFNQCFRKALTRITEASTVRPLILDLSEAAAEAGEDEIFRSIYSAAKELTTNSKEQQELLHAFFERLANRNSALEKDTVTWFVDQLPAKAVQDEMSGLATLLPDKMPSRHFTYALFRFRLRSAPEPTPPDYCDLLLQALATRYEKVVTKVLKLGKKMHSMNWFQCRLTLENFKKATGIWVTALYDHGSHRQHFASNFSVTRYIELCEALGRCLDYDVQLDPEFIIFVAGHVPTLEKFWPIEPRPHLEMELADAYLKKLTADKIDPLQGSADGKKISNVVQHRSFRFLFFTWSCVFQPSALLEILNFCGKRHIEIKPEDHYALNEIMLRWQYQRLLSGKEMAEKEVETREFRNAQTALVKLAQHEKDMLSQRLDEALDRARKWIRETASAYLTLRGLSLPQDAQFSDFEDTTFGTNIVLNFFLSHAHLVAVSKKQGGLSFQGMSPVSAIVDESLQFSAAVRSPILQIRDLELPLALQGGGRGQRWLTTIEQQVMLTDACESILANHVHAPFFFATDTRYGWFDYDVKDRAKHTNLYTHYPVRIQGPPYSGHPINHRVWTTPFVRLRFALKFGVKEESFKPFVQDDKQDQLAVLKVAADLNKVLQPREAMAMFTAAAPLGKPERIGSGTTGVFVEFRFVRLDMTQQENVVKDMYSLGNCDFNDNTGLLCVEIHQVKCADNDNRRALVQFIVDTCRAWARPIVVTRSAALSINGPVSKGSDQNIFEMLWKRYALPIERPHPRFALQTEGVFADKFLWIPQKRMPSVEKPNPERNPEPVNINPDLAPEGPKDLVVPDFERLLDTKMISRPAKLSTHLPIALLSAHAYRTMLMDARED